MTLPSDKAPGLGLVKHRALALLLAIVLGAVNPPPSNAEALEQSSIPDLSGTWRLTVEGLDIWAPPYTLIKTTGRIHWRLSIANGELSLFEQDSGQRADTAFDPVRVREVIVRDDLIAFKVAGEVGAYEAYWLENFSDKKITGTYTVYDLYGGGPGWGPEYRARLLLQKVE